MAGVAGEDEGLGPGLGNLEVVLLGPERASQNGLWGTSLSYYWGCHYSHNFPYHQGLLGLEFSEGLTRKGLNR